MRVLPIAMLAMFLAVSVGAESLSGPCQSEHGECIESGECGELLKCLEAHGKKSNLRDLLKERQNHLDECKDAEECLKDKEPIGGTSNPFEAHRSSVYLGDESKLGKTVANRCDLQRVEGVWYCYDDKLGGIRPYCDALPHGTNPEVYCWEQEAKEPVVRKDSRHLSGEEKLYLRIDKLEHQVEFLLKEKIDNIWEIDEMKDRIKWLEEAIRKLGISKSEMK